LDNMNWKGMKDTAGDLAEVSFYVLWGAITIMWLTSFPNPVSDAVYAWKFTAQGEPIEAPQGFKSELNQVYQQSQNHNNKEFGYCVEIRQKNIVDYTEVIYEGNRSNTVLGETKCPQGEWNGLIHSQPISCQMTNRDMYTFGVGGTNGLDYFGLICDPGKMFFLNKDDLYLNTRYPVQTVDFK